MTETIKIALSREQVQTLCLALYDAQQSLRLAPPRLRPGTDATSGLLRDYAALLSIFSKVSQSFDRAPGTGDTARPEPRTLGQVLHEARRAQADSNPIFDYVNDEHDKLAQVLRDGFAGGEPRTVAQVLHEAAMAQAAEEVQRPDGGSLRLAAMKAEDRGPHPSHQMRISDSSLYDFRCVLCDRTDESGVGWGKLREPCPKATRPQTISEMRDPTFTPRGQQPEHPADDSGLVSRCRELGKMAEQVISMARDALEDAEMINAKLYAIETGHEDPMKVDAAGRNFLRTVFGMIDAPVSDEMLVELTEDTGHEDCAHDWVDPSNEVVRAGTWRLCVRCGRLKDFGALVSDDLAPTIVSTAMPDFDHRVAECEKCGQRLLQKCLEANGYKCDTCGGGSFRLVPLSFEAAVSALDLALGRGGEWAGFTVNSIEDIEKFHGLWCVKGTNLVPHKWEADWFAPVLNTERCSVCTRTRPYKFDENAPTRRRTD